MNYTDPDLKPGDGTVYIPGVRLLSPDVRRRLYAYYFAVCVPWGAAYFLLPNTPVSKLVLYNGLGASAVVAMLVGIRVNRPERPKAWYLFAAGLTSFLTADVIFYVLNDVMGNESFPSVADLFYLGMYPLVIAGLLILIRANSPGRDAPSLIDAGIASTGMFAVLWILLMDSYVEDESLTFIARVVSLAYPVMDVALLAVLARLAVVVRLRRPALILMIVGVGCLLIADTGYGLTVLAGTYHTGGPIDAFWMLFYVLFATAALHPSMVIAVEPAEHGPGSLTWRRLGILSVVTVTVPLINLAFGGITPIDRVVVTIASVALFLLVLGRIWLLMQAVRASHESMRHQALHDSLTGLANRVLFAQVVEDVLADPIDGEFVAVLFVDVDDFKSVNDSLGHQTGDLLLEEAALRLVGCVRSEDIVARFGGDEFAIFLSHAAGTQEAVMLAARILEVFEEPVFLADREVRFSVSIGIAVEQTSSGDVETLLRSADVSMYLAKAKGKRRYELFEQSMYDQVVDRIELGRDLQGALSRGELEVYYQPVFDLRNQGVESIEALLRWNHPTRGLIEPDGFVPLAEETGMIVEIGQWVLDQSCHQVKLWQQDRSECARLSVSVNLSVRQLYDPALVGQVAAAIQTRRLDPSLLMLEVTESVLMHDADFGAKVLERLKLLGVKIAIDDFGTGYSSFAYLRSFPIDTIKIDRSFVMDLQDGGTTAALVCSVIDLAKALSLTTVAEGVEEAAQLAVLDDLECDFVQGYYFAKPMTAREMERFFDEVLLREHSDTALAHPSLPRAEREVTLSPGLATRFNVEVQRTHAGLDRLGEELDGFHADTGAPVTARRRWLGIWSEVHTEWEPLSVVVRNRRRRTIDAAAFLAQSVGPDGIRVVGLGHERGSGTRLPGRDALSISALVEGITQVLTSLPSPWRLELEQLPSTDPVAVMLTGHLVHAHLVPDARIPRVAISSRDALHHYLSRSMRRQIQRARSRIEAEGIALEITFERDHEVVAALLPRLQDIHVERDHLTRRASDLDDPSASEFWQRVLMSHSEAGEVEIAMLRLDGEIAAYVVAIIDGRSWRVFDGHMVSRFSAFSPGRIIEAAALERVVADESLDEVDWMSGVEAGKLLGTNASSARARLIAFSEPDDQCVVCQEDLAEVINR